jgi:glycosyltransferase involved in cell wall biosynthesis
MSKKRILFVGEASFLSTGFATYYRELLQRLAATDKYEIAELGSYADDLHAGVTDFIAGRWKFYGGQPVPTDQENWQRFHTPTHPRTKGQPTNQFGEWRFDEVCAEFQPDIVIDIRDWWMLEFQERSCFRDWYKWLVMPTVDAEPQQEEWMYTYENADLVLAYSDYGIDVLKSQSVKAKIFPTPMRPGVDLSVFKPDPSARDRFAGIAPDVTVIGTVMRNQSRKLYPDLIDAFACMKTKYKGEAAVDKAVLMIHSCWPDNAHSFDYPRHVKRLAENTGKRMPWAYKMVKSDILQTFMCHNCDGRFVGWAMSLWGQPIQNKEINGKQVRNAVFLPCVHCGQQTATPPTTGQGFTREELASVYSTMDIYVQCSICEGDGMPIQEAKACGVPTLVTDYTAMSEKGRLPSEYTHLADTIDSYSCHKGGETIDIGRYYYEPETSCKRAHPDVEDMALKMRNLVVDDVRRKQMSEDARVCAETNYNWDELFKRWEFVLDKVRAKPRANTWDSPIKPVAPIQPQAIPDGLDNDQYIVWLYTTILKYDRVDAEGAKTWMEHLQSGVPREKLLEHFVNIGNQQQDTHAAREQVRAKVAGIDTTQATEATGTEWV